jgi:hypothetical protein
MQYYAKNPVFSPQIAPCQHCFYYVKLRDIKMRIILAAYIIYLLVNYL